MEILHDALFITAWLTGSGMLACLLYRMLTQPARPARIIGALALVAGMLALSRMA